MKFFAVVLAVVVLAITVSYDITASNKHIYNNGIHRDCGCHWVHYERDRTGREFYCAGCGAEFTLQK